MRCPTCNSTEHVSVNLHADGYSPQIVECGVCSTVWSTQHDQVSIIKDPASKSFLSGDAEPVEGYDYGIAAAL